MKYQRIVWLASYPKSGNTWVRCMLDAYYRGKVDINDLSCSVSDDISFRHDVGDGSDPREYPADIQHLTRPMALLRLVRAHADSDIGLPLFVKTHSVHGIANGIELLPQSLTHKVIHIVRDPRDVAISWSKHLGASIDDTIEFMADRMRTLTGQKNQAKMRDLISSWQFHTQSYAQNDSGLVKTFRYEDMMQRPGKTFAAMLKHAGVKVDEAKAGIAAELCALANLKKQEAEKGFKEQSPKASLPFFGDGGSKWRSVLTERQRREIEKMAGRWIVKYWPESETNGAKHLRRA